MPRKKSVKRLVFCQTRGVSEGSKRPNFLRFFFVTLPLDIDNDSISSPGHKCSIWKLVSLQKICLKCHKNCECFPLSVFIEGSLWILKLLFSIVRNVIRVSKVTSSLFWMSLSLSFCWSDHVSSSLWVHFFRIALHVDRPMDNVIYRAVLGQLKNSFCL